MMKWLVNESDHYVFHVHAGSLAQKDIEEIMEYQEHCLKYVLQVLRLELEEKIHYFLCDSLDEVGMYYGDYVPCSSFFRDPFEIYAVYSLKQKAIGFHQDVLLLANLINRPNVVAIREGLAMFFNKKWFGVHNFEWVLYWLENDQYVSLQRLMKDEYFYDYPPYLTYPVVGAFTQYLIMTYGMDKYLSFYRLNESTVNKRFKEMYGEGIRTIEKEFLDYVRLFKLDYAMKERIIELISEM